MKPPPFTLLRPSSLDEALAAFGEHGDEARPLAGGQSLLPMMNMRLARPTALIDLNRLTDLAGVTRDNGTVRIGAMVRQAELTESPDIAAGVPLLAQCGPWIGHWVTRNRGTVGGSIAHADARGEIPLSLAALGGSVVAASVRGTRELSADDLFVGHFATSLADDELLIETRWPAAGRGWGYAFEELAQRHGDFALGMVACALRVEDGAVREARIAVGALADRPLLVDDLATALVGQVIDSETARAASAEVAGDLDLHDDLHSPATYQRHLTRVLVARALVHAWERATA